MTVKLNEQAAFGTLLQGANGLMSGVNTQQGSTAVDLFANMAIGLLLGGGLSFGGGDVSGVQSDINESKTNSNDIKQTEEKTKQNTQSQLDAFKAKIEDYINQINENIQKVEDANKEKEEIQAKVEEQTEIIEQAAAFLNGEAESFNNGNGDEQSTKRTEAIRLIRDAGAEISNLVQRSDALSNLCDDAQSTIDGLVGNINTENTQMAEVVQTSNEELNNLDEKAAAESTSNANLSQKGEQLVAEGELKALVDPTAAQKVAVGTEAIATAAASDATNTATQGLIKVDLTQFEATKTGIGSMVNAGVSLAEQLQASFGVVGEWTAEFNTTVSEETETLADAADQAEKLIGNESADGSQVQPQKEEQNGEKKEAVFKYDTSKLRALGGKKAS